MSSKPQVINNQFYGANDDSDNSLYGDTNFEVANEAVIVSSPAYSEKENPPYYSTESSIEATQHGTSHGESYSTELPTRIYPSTASSEEANDLHNSIQFSKHPYDHSDIAYSPSDTEILTGDNNNLNSQYPMSTPGEFTETRTEAPEKNKFSKPIFKLKPTPYPSSTEQYVLVHTISNDKQADENLTKKPSTNESIQSIILMLNGSNPGPEYSMNMNSNYNSPSTPSYDSTSMIDREKYGASSYYITTKTPSHSNRPTTSNVPSTSYIFSPNPTRRQTTKTTTTKNANRIKITPTRSPQKPTTLNVPSTSYVYSPSPITKRPTTTASSSSTHTIKTTATIIRTTPKPTIIVKQPTSNVGNDYVVISGGGITKHPSPTVHITPKPITNILTSSLLNTKPTKRPSGEKSPTTQASPTERPPPSFGTTPATFISSSIYMPAIQDFHNEGYFVVTHRPAAGVSSTAVYTISSGPYNEKPTPSYIANDPVNFNDVAPAVNNDDFSNFPPVRNPNLNMTATLMDETEISTPSFVEDEQLNGKIDLLVNKLVASMQGNLDNLVDIVYERKNVSDAVHDISNLNKNGTLPSDAKPPKVSKVTTLKPPPRVPTGRPGQATTKKAPSKAPSATKKPSTGSKRPTTKPLANSPPSKKPPGRVTTTVATKKPTRRVTTTTTSTTERAPAEDEIIEEEGEEVAEGAEEGAEEIEEENAAEETESEVTFAPVESGKIREKHCS